MIDHGSVREKINIFYQRHGPESYTDGVARYYPDGAVRDVNPLGALIEPPDARTPDGEWQRELNKLQFARLKLKGQLMNSMS